MANPDDYWRFLAQAILQQSQAGSAQAMQVAQMNMALEDQRMKAQQYQQDLELRRQQLEQSKAESQARIAESNAATQDRIALTKEREKASTIKSIDDQTFYMQHGMYPEQAATEQAYTKGQNDLTEGATRNELLQAQTEGVKSENKFAPIKRGLDLMKTNADIEASRASVRASDSAAKANTLRAEIEKAANDSLLAKNTFELGKNLNDYGRMLLGKLPLEDEGKLGAHMSTVAAAAVAKMGENFLAMNQFDKFTPEEQNKLRSAIINTGMQYGALSRLNMLNPAMHDELEQKMMQVVPEVRAASGGKLTVSDVETVVNRFDGLIKDYASKVAGPDSRSTGTESINEPKVALPKNSASAQANLGKMQPKAQDRKDAILREEEERKALESAVSSLLNPPAMSMSDGSTNAALRNEIKEYVKKFKSEPDVGELGAYLRAKFDISRANKDQAYPGGSLSQYIAEQIKNKLQAGTPISLTESRPTSRPDSR